MTERKQTAIVTGASGGLGRAIAQAFLDRGFNVVMAGANAERLTAAERLVDTPTPP